MERANTAIGPNLKRLLKATRYFEQHENLFSSHAAFRKYLDGRRSNGLTDSGAVVETVLGLMINPPRFRTWLLGIKPIAIPPRVQQSRRSTNKNADASPSRNSAGAGSLNDGDDIPIPGPRSTTAP